MENIICLQRWLLAGKVVGSLNTAEMMAAWLGKQVQKDAKGHSSSPWPTISSFTVSFLAAMGI